MSTTSQPKTKPTIKDLLLIGIKPVFTVKYDRVWEDWIVHHPTNKAANSHHGTDKEDAINTAHAMAREHNLKEGDYVVRVKG